MKIRVLFIFYALLVVSLILLGFGAAFLSSEKKHEQQFLQDRKKQLILQMSNICERAFYENNLIFEGFRQGLEKEIGFVSASCLDMEGNEMDFSSQAKTGPVSSTRHSGKPIDPNLIFDDQISLPSGHAGYEMVAPLLLGGQQAGFAKLVFDQVVIDKHLKKFTTSTIRHLVLMSLFPFMLALLGSWGFAKALQRLHDLDEKKKELISSVTHEFRSPITAINSFVSLLLKGIYGEPNSKQREALSIVRNNTLRLSQFVDDLLSMAQFEENGVKLFIEEINSSELIESLKKIYEPLAQEKKLNLKLTLTREAFLIKTDHSKLFQILENLVSNAIKYTESGFVEIGAAITDRQKEFFVLDSGHGISPEDLKQIFEPFFRAPSQRLSAKGTGLGLAIVKSYASVIGAKIEVYSELGKGSRFSVIFEEKRV